MSRVKDGKINMKDICERISKYVHGKMQILKMKDEIDGKTKYVYRIDMLYPYQISNPTVDRNFKVRNFKVIWGDFALTKTSAYEKFVDVVCNQEDDGNAWSARSQLKELGLSGDSPEELSMNLAILGF